MRQHGSCRSRTRTAHRGSSRASSPCRFRVAFAPGQLLPKTGQHHEPCSRAEHGVRCGRRPLNIISARVGNGTHVRVKRRPLRIDVKQRGGRQPHPRAVGKWKHVVRLRPRAPPLPEPALPRVTTEGRRRDGRERRLRRRRRRIQSSVDTRMRSATDRCDLHDTPEVREPRNEATEARLSITEDREHHVER